MNVKVQKMVVRAVMVSGFRDRRGQEAELEVSQMEMLSFSLGGGRMDEIRNGTIRGTAQKGPD